MSLIKKQKIDKVEFVGDWKTIQVRHLIEIKEDDVVISESYHRSSYEINIGIAGLPVELRPYATGVWTDEFIAEWNVYKTEMQAKQKEIDSQN